MEREAMSCEVVRETLPLLSGADEAEASRVREHVAGCEPCRELMESYQADAVALGALRDAQQGAAPIMAGFTEDLFDRITHESSAQPRGQVIAFEQRTSTMRWLAAAAAVLLIVTVGLIANVPVQPAGPGSLAEQDAQPAASVEAPAPAPQLASEDLAPLPAVDADTAPMPRRRIGRATNPEVLPADGRGRGPRGARAVELDEALQRMLPGLRHLFQPPERPGDRDGEVSF